MKGVENLSHQNSEFDKTTRSSFTSHVSFQSDIRPSWQRMKVYAREKSFFTSRNTGLPGFWDPVDGLQAGLR